MYSVSAMLVVLAGIIGPLGHSPDSSRGLIRGTVTDSTGAPIRGAEVIVLEAHRQTSTDARGRYLLTSMPEGVYAVSFRAIGYRPTIHRVAIGANPLQLDVTLQRSVVELAPIQVTATPLATSALESPQPIAVLQAEALRAAQAPSLGAVLESQAGLRNYSTGSGIAKPVIRGLTGPRVLILDNGQRMETQQWGDEHAPNVETANAERIEVVRGPASVLYGSDALGGVINVVQRSLPDATQTGSIINGTTSLGFSSNNRMPDGSLMVEGGQGRFGFRVTGSGRSGGDLQTPSGTLSNSAISMGGGSAAIGWHSSGGNLTARYSERVERLEIHEDPTEVGLAEPFQRIRSQRLAASGDASLGSSRIELDLGWERNHRREFESPIEESVGALDLGLLSTTLGANLHLHHAASSKIAGVVGLSGLNTQFDKSGTEDLIPGSRTRNVAAYGFEQVDLGLVQLAVGGRIDRRWLDNDADLGLGIDAGRRSWTAVTGNFGSLFRLAKSTAMAVNVGRGFRAPSSFELFANGEHEGSARYEIGDATLDTERSLNLDVALRFHTADLQAEVGVFRNAIAGYIYPKPTGDIDQESGLPVYRIVQGDAVLSGFEAAADWHPTKSLHLRGVIDHTRGDNSDTEQPLPFIGPLRISGSVRYEGSGGSIFLQRHLQFGFESNKTQTRLDPDDIAPEGYTLVNGLVGGVVAVGGGIFRVDLQLRNLFNVGYRSFLSRYKRYADDPGRNLILRVGVDL